MEKKNTVLLTVIAVATLLVAVVGATFAYFTATNTSNVENAGTVDTKTQEVKPVSFASTAISGDVNLDYPGGTSVFGTSVTGTRDASDKSANKYQVSYDLSLAYTSELTSSLAYEVYESDSEINIDNVKAGCTVNRTPVGNDIQYSYTCTKDNAAVKTAMTTAGAKLLTGDNATGEIVTGTNQTISVATGLSIADLTTTSAAANKFYYVVLYYANSGDQSADMGKAINVSLKVVNPEIKSVANS